MWDPGWDDVPPPARDPGSPAGGNSASREDRAGEAEASGRRAGEGDAGGSGTGWLDDSEGPRPGRWYAPSTSRGKLILLLTVAAVLVLTLVACCVGIAGLARLRSVDPFGLI